MFESSLFVIQITNQCVWRWLFASGRM